jgi:hypothetical protein
MASVVFSIASLLSFSYFGILFFGGLDFLEGLLNIKSVAALIPYTILPTKPDLCGVVA